MTNMKKACNRKRIILVQNHEPKYCTVIISSQNIISHNSYTKRLSRHGNHFEQCMKKIFNNNLLR